MRKCTYKEHNAFFSLQIGNSFSALELKKIQLQGGKNYFILLLANENAECNQLENKTNTIKTLLWKIRNPSSNQSTSYVSSNHYHKNWKYSLDTRAVLLIFSLEFEISGMTVQRIHQNSQNYGLCEEVLSENNFQAVLSTFCCYDYGANASEAVHKIIIDHKDYQKCSLFVIVCWIAKRYQSIAVKNDWLLTY